MALDQLDEGNAHLLFDRAGGVHMARDAKQLGARVVGLAERGEPGRATAQDVRHNGDRLDIIDGGGGAIEPAVCGERRLEPGLALFAFKAFEQRRLLAADIGACAVVNVEVEIPAVVVVLANEPCVIGLGDRRLEALALAEELAANVDIGDMGPHGE